MIGPEESKARSRGVSRDMSDQAISRRFDILVELDQAARALESAHRTHEQPKRTQRRGRRPDR